MSHRSVVRRAPWRVAAWLAPLAVAGVVFAASPGAAPSAEGVRVVTPAQLVPASGFSFELAVEVPLSRVDAYDVFTNEIAQWWDHTLAGDPGTLSLDARPAGGFVEGFPRGADAGPSDGARHATVTLAQRGERLVFLGQLGLVGLPFLGFHDLRFESVDGDATHTRVTLTASGIGILDDGTESVVQDVWTHFLTRYAAHASAR
ncbi:MAG: hypothetical protein H6825_11400 [Planctomycetes bacterium]|nr:hypothetical protein [Planctomycetota bacterium]